MRVIPQFCFAQQGMIPHTVSNNTVALLAWQDLQIGGGGYISGTSIAADGTLVIRTDTYGAYVLLGTSWQQLVTSLSMPSGATQGVNNGGVYEIAISSSNPNIAFMIPLDGFMYKTTNLKSAPNHTWTKLTNFAQVTVAPNDNSIKNLNHYVAIDPNNSLVIVAGTPSNGARISLDGGATWTHIATIANATGGKGCLVEFDTHGGTTGGSTNNIYVSSYGTGPYLSLDGGATWALCNTTGMPTLFQKIRVDQMTGVLWTTDDSSFNLKKYSGGGTAGTWTSVNPTSVNGGGALNGNARSIALNPASSSKLTVCSGDAIGYSSNGMSTFTSLQFLSGGMSLTGDQTWESRSGVSTLSIADVVFDPSQSGVMWLCTGFGITYLNPDLCITNNATVLNTLATGIEEVVSANVLATPHGDVLLGSEDFPIFHKASSTFGSNATSCQPAYQNAVGGTLAYCYSMDYAANNTSFVAALISGNINESLGSDFTGVSSDGGVSWTPINGVPPATKYDGDGGNIGVIDSTHFSWISASSIGNSYTPQWTSNGGTSWNDATGAPHQQYMAASGFLPASKFMCVDKQTGSGTSATVYLYAPSNLGANPSPGFYKSTNSGQSYSLMSAVVEGSHDAGQAILKVNPGIVGDVWWCAGNSLTYFDATRFLWRWNGSAFAKVTGFGEVFCFGFGATVPGQSHPAIAVAGVFNSNYGIWISIDNASTWTNIGTYPNGWFTDPTDFDGDKVTAGGWFLAINGSGYKRYG